MKIKIRLKELLEEKHILQKELALKCSVTEATISRYISGKRKLNIEKAYIIARCLGIDINELWEVIDE